MILTCQRTIYSRRGFVDQMDLTIKNAGKKWMLKRDAHGESGAVYCPSNEVGAKP